MSNWPELEAQLRRSAGQRFGPGHRRDRRRVSSGAMVVLLVGLLVVVVLAGDLRGPRSDERIAQPGPGPTVAATPFETAIPVETPSPGPIEPLSVLEQPASPSASLPSAVQAQIAETTEAKVRPALGRKALTTRFGGTFYVVPATGSIICLEYASSQSAPVGAGACSPESQIPTGGFSGAICRAEGYLLYGMLPNHAENPRLLLADGETRALDLVNNVWWFSDSDRLSHATTLTWTERAHDNRAPAPQPPPTC